MFKNHTTKSYRKTLTIIGFMAFMVSVSMWAQSSAPGIWRAVGNMTATRDSHTATALPNGLVLVAGGTGSCDVSPGNHCVSAELFNPATGTWKATGTMTVARANHIAVLLRNGKVLVAGGFTASAELYDPSNGQWTVTGSMSISRAKHAAAVLPNGNVLVAGGVNATNDLATIAEIYDPATGVWTPTGSMTLGRMEFTMTRLPNQMVLAAGGLNLSSGATNTAEIYDPATGTWTATAPMAVARMNHTATLLPTGQVMAAGGSDASGVTFIKTAELYDPSTGAWTFTGSMAHRRSLHTSTLLTSGTVLAVGGLTNCIIEGPCFSTGSAELYDPSSGQWSAAAKLLPTRSSHTATVLGGRVVLVSGGLQSTRAGGTDLANASVFVP